MITHTETLYRQAERYQRQRRELLEEKAEKLRDLERYRGSAGFADDVRASERQYTERLNNLKYTFLEDAGTVLNGMEKAISRRKMTPPTDEQLRILQALKLKSNVTRDELDQAAEALRNCPVGLSILDDLAKTSGYPMRYHRLGQMSNDTARDVVAGLREQVRDFAESDRSRAGRLFARYNLKYNTVPLDVPKRKEFSSQEEFYGQFAGLDPSELSAFTEATEN